MTLGRITPTTQQDIRKILSIESNSHILDSFQRKLEIICPNHKGEKTHECSDKMPLIQAIVTFIETFRLQLDHQAFKPVCLDREIFIDNQVTAFSRQAFNDEEERLKRTKKHILTNRKAFKLARLILALPEYSILSSHEKGSSFFYFSWRPLLNIPLAIQSRDYRSGLIGNSHLSDITVKIDHENSIPGHRLFLQQLKDWSELYNAESEVLNLTSFENQVNALLKNLYCGERPVEERNQGLLPWEIEGQSFISNKENYFKGLLEHPDQYPDLPLDLCISYNNKEEEQIEPHSLNLHRLIMCQSPFLAGLANVPMKESKQEILPVQLDGYFAPDVVFSFAKFLYLGTLHSSEFFQNNTFQLNKTLNLLKLARYMLVTDLENLCLRMINQYTLSTDVYDLINFSDEWKFECFNELIQSLFKELNNVSIDDSVPLEHLINCYHIIEPNIPFKQKVFERASQLIREMYLRLQNQEQTQGESKDEFIELCSVVKPHAEETFLTFIRSSAEFCHFLVTNNLYSTTFIKTLLSIKDSL
jgi:hypothetical protein